MKRYFLFLLLLFPMPSLSQNQSGTPEWFKQDEKWAKNEKKLFAEAEKGNKVALESFLGLFQGSDGADSEILSESLSEFCLNHPQLVLKYWKLLMNQDNEQVTRSALEYMCTLESGEKIKKLYLKYCKKNDPRFKIILQYVKKEEEEVKQQSYRISNP